MSIERRFFDNTPELRTDGDSNIVEGFGMVYNSLSQNFAPYIDGGLYEIIDPGAARGLLDDEDIMILFNHDQNLVLARNKNTATLEETENGVKYRYTSPNTTVANDLLENLRLKNVRKSSFAFKVKEAAMEKREFPGLGKINLRRIRSFQKLYDMSPVTYPAYNDTTALKRAFEEFNGSSLSLFERERGLKIKLYKK